MTRAVDAIGVVLAINGLYDALCAASILGGVRAPHTGMLASEEHSGHPLVRRLLAYWLLTYGAARFAAGLHRENADLIQLAALTYLIEGLCFGYELCGARTLVPWKGAFVALTSLALALVVAA